MSAIDKYILSEGTYTIADNCTYYLGSKRTIHVIPKKRTHLGDNDKRCKDCKYRTLGRSSKTYSNETYICLQRPKGRVPSNIFYHASAYGRPCEFFKQKKN